MPTFLPRSDTSAAIAARLNAAIARAVAAGQDSEAGAASDALVDYIEAFARKTME